MLTNAVTLALLEASSIVAAVCGTIRAWNSPLPTDRIEVAAVLGPAGAVALCFVVSFYYNDLYDLQVVRSFAEFTARLPRALGVASVLSIALYALFPRVDAPVFVSLPVAGGLLVSLRAISYRLLRDRLRSERVLIVGASPLARKLVEEIEARPHLRYSILGVVDDAGELPGGYPHLGPLARLDKIIKEVRPDRIIVSLAERRGRLPVHQLLLAQVCDGVFVEDGAEVYERLTEKLALEALTPSNLLFCNEFRKSRLALASGRVVSLVAAVLGLVTFAPLFVVIALAIKLDSSGPVFFVQERAGMCGRRFKLIKFRTMRPVDRDTSLWYLDNQQRITRLGRWLRKFRLDELPQFLNVLRGDMNLVGPRAQRVPKFELLALVARNMPESGEAIPYFSLRSMVPPGITGWAQVRYRYAHNLEEEIEKTRYDLYYIKHMSVWLDLRILFDTVKTVLSGRGSGPADAHGVNPRELTAA